MWRKRSLREKTAIVLVTVFILIFCIQNIIYIKHDGFKTTDFQLSNVLNYYIDIFRNPESTSNITYPPLTYLVTMAHFYVMGISQHTARLSLMIFWIIFLMAMFGIGYQYGGSYSGFTVMALSASSPHVLEYSRIYFLDFPQAATTALAFYILLKTDKFRNRFYSILFGFAMTLTLMAKWSAVFFMIIPILWFLIPTIFKSKKTIKTFLVFLITFLVSISGTFLYYKLILQRQSDPDFWYINFILSIIIPTGINFLITRRLDREFQKGEGYVGSPEQKTVNFNFSTIPIIFFTGAWISWAGRAIASRYMIERHDIREFAEVYRRMFEYGTAIKTLFSFGIILFIIGLCCMIIRKRKDMILLILSSLVSFCLVFELATYDIDPTRYLFSIIIFLAPVCGFWVIYTGKAKGYITISIVILSLFSILAWTLIPGDLSIYYPVKFRLILSGESFPMKVLCTEPPDPAVIDFREVIKNMKPDDFNNRQYSYYLVFSSRLGDRHEMAIREKLNLDFIKCSKRAGITEVDFNDYSNPFCTFFPHSLRQLGVSNVLLVSENGSAPEHLIKKINKHFKFSKEIKKIHIGKRYWVTLLRIENDFSTKPATISEEIETEKQTVNDDEIIHKRE